MTRKNNSTFKNLKFIMFLFVIIIGVLVLFDIVTKQKVMEAASAMSLLYFILDHMLNNEKSYNNLDEK